MCFAPYWADFAFFIMYWIVVCPQILAILYLVRAVPSPSIVKLNYALSLSDGGLLGAAGLYF
jgi:hypothetical protein